MRRISSLSQLQKALKEGMSVHAELIQYSETCAGACGDCCLGSFGYTCGPYDEYIVETVDIRHMKDLPDEAYTSLRGMCDRVDRYHECDQCRQYGAMPHDLAWNIFAS